MRWPPSLRWVRGVRVRTALSATVVVAVALAVAAASLVVLQRRELVQGLTTVAQQQSSQVAAQITHGGVESVDIAAVSASASAGERALIQVVTPEGVVAAASTTVQGEQPASSATPGAGEVVIQTLDRLPIGEDEPFVVVTTGVRTPQGSPG